jgi:hypothetical protein
MFDNVVLVPGGLICFSQCCCIVGETHFLRDESRKRSCTAACSTSCSCWKGVGLGAASRDLPSSLTLVDGPSWWVFVVFGSGKSGRACTGILSRDYGSAPTCCYSIVESHLRLSGPEKVRNKPPCNKKIMQTGNGVWNQSEVNHFLLKLMLVQCRYSYKRCTRSWTLYVHLYKMSPALFSCLVEIARVSTVGH